MAQPNRPWYLQTGIRVPENVTPGQPRREVAQEFYTNVIELGRMARERYLDECRVRARAFDQAELDDLDANIAILEAAMAQHK